MKIQSVLLETWPEKTVYQILAESPVLFALTDIALSGTNYTSHKHKRRQGVYTVQVHSAGLEHQANLLSMWAYDPALTRITHTSENAISRRNQSTKFSGRGLSPWVHPAAKIPATPVCSHLRLSPVYVKPAVHTSLNSDLCSAILTHNIPDAFVITTVSRVAAYVLSRR